MDFSHSLKIFQDELASELRGLQLNFGLISDQKKNFYSLDKIFKEFWRENLSKEIK